MSVKAITVYEVQCDQCGKWLKNAFYELVQADSEQEAYQRARDLGWHTSEDYPFAIHACTDCQKENQE
ncbi:hypothetical protein [Bifidobacterium cuniculi]|uniref:Uncharacterized protein n=1 Tax=Bifidobacterium cuniculi TaxID=1688 RepID=A0A087B4Z6_9BIFI|nr:hypothetical protein [Bifidobacterium cuniculi]KFI66096.1 hypothetical protein BCUN_0598 [Bifidobacterium cuniculi]